MNMNISCNGSPPFYYCWVVVPTNQRDLVNALLDNASCELPIKTLNCEFQLLHYFSSSGQYILPVVLYNQVSYKVIPLKVNVYEGNQ